MTKRNASTSTAAPVWSGRSLPARMRAAQLPQRISAGAFAQKHHHHLRKVLVIARLVRASMNDERVVVQSVPVEIAAGLGSLDESRRGQRTCGQRPSAQRAPERLDLVPTRGARGGTGAQQEKSDERRGSRALIFRAITEIRNAASLLTP